MTRAFISFDFDHDKDLLGNLVTQAKKPDSPFSFADYSVKEPLSNKWQKQVRHMIRKVDVVIVICGAHTHTAKGVAAELTITQKEGKPYFLLRGRREITCTKPATARSSDKMHSWTWNNLKTLIAHRGRP